MRCVWKTIFAVLVFASMTVTLPALADSGGGDGAGVEPSTPAAVDPVNELIVEAQRAYGTAAEKADEAAKRSKQAQRAAAESKAAKAAGKEDDAKFLNGEARGKALKAAQAAREANEAAEAAKAAYEKAQALDPKPTQADLDRVKAASDLAAPEAQRASAAAEAAGAAVRDLPL
jgi:hypothetical protein